MGRLPSRSFLPAPPSRARRRRGIARRAGRRRHRRPPPRTRLGQVHGVPGLAGATPLGDGSGFFVGGVKAASNAVAEGDARAEDFKFFFNTLKWSV